VGDGGNCITWFRGSGRRSSGPFRRDLEDEPREIEVCGGLPPREQIATITVKKRHMQVKVEAITAEGKKTVVRYEIPYDGGMGRMFETSPAYDGILGKHLGPYEREISRLKDGKAVFTARSIVSPDGNLMSVYSKGVSPLGKPVEAHVVYDRVK
jgi:hypothetical protein